MNIKGAVKYQLISVMKAFLIFYGVVMAIRGMGIGFALVGDGKLHMSGTEINSIVFMGFLGAYTFLDDFRFLVQNGYSRKSMIISFLIEFCVVASLLSAVDILFELLTKTSLAYASLYTQLYGSGNVLYQFFWGFLLNMIAGLIVFFITVLISRMGKQQKMVILLIVPILLIMSISLIELQYTHGAIMNWFKEVIYTIFGFEASGIQYWNPVLYLSAGSLLFIALSYLTARRAPIKG